ncbi:hypothetical protein [Arthrobacter sp. TB 23]|uniref:hypothetical protein n=1 Tax=Arthrobacter sp. TB 23 TaxID=494419 RepID=UPI0002F4D89A|nr:hypothetical protein [Arthrobacter sp. TB 23]
MPTAYGAEFRQDVLGIITVWSKSGWPDLVLGLIIIVVNVTAAKEVWETAQEEHLAAKALAGEDIA